MAVPFDIFKDSPFPEVAESLRPYIKTRQDAARIRQGLHSALPLSSLHTAQLLPLENVNSSTLTGVRRAYWRALQAHQAAQSQYDSLKAELEQVIQQQSGKAHDLSSFDDSSSLLTESYIPLLRQKEKHRKLNIIDRTSARINVTGGDAVTDSFDKIVKRKVGELAAPPSTSAFSERETWSRPDFDLTELKRAILSVKQQVDGHETFVGGMDGPYNVDNPHADLRGLQKAHNELTTWMETQLALISDMNASKSSTESNGVHYEMNGNGADSSSEIETLYETYLDARQQLLSTVAGPTSTTSTDVPVSENSQGRSSEVHEIEQRATIAEILLPLLSNMVAVKQNEQTLLHQGTYSRRRIFSAESQTRAVLVRLADESHLVEPKLSREAPQGRDWNQAAETAAETNNKSALQRLVSGKASAEAASATLENIRSIPIYLDSLVG